MKFIFKKYTDTFARGPGVCGGCQESSFIILGQVKNTVHLFCTICKEYDTTDRYQKKTFPDYSYTFEPSLVVKAKRIYC